MEKASLQRSWRTRYMVPRYWCSSELPGSFIKKTLSEQLHPRFSVGLGTGPTFLKYLGNSNESSSRGYFKKHSKQFICHLQNCCFTVLFFFPKCLYLNKAHILTMAGHLRLVTKQLLHSDHYIDDRHFLHSPWCTKVRVYLKRK